MLPILKDLVAHVNPIGSVSLMRLIQKGDHVQIDGFNDEKTLIIFAKTHKELAGFDDTFGMGDFNKLAYLLKSPEYQDSPKIEIKTENRNGSVIPTEITFENKLGDFKNRYKFVHPEIVNEKLKSITFSEPSWDVVFEPAMTAIARLKLMSGAHSDEAVFQLKTKNDNLMLIFGDANTHGGEFVFHPDVKKNISNNFYWPNNIFTAILNLDGDKKISISNEGLVKISVNSGLINYEYLIPAQQK